MVCTPCLYFSIFTPFLEIAVTRTPFSTSDESLGLFLDNDTDTVTVVGHKTLASFSSRNITVLGLSDCIWTSNSGVIQSFLYLKTNLLSIDRLRIRWCHGKNATKKGWVEIDWTAGHCACWSDWLIWNILFLLFSTRPLTSMWSTNQWRRATCLCALPIPRKQCALTW